MKHLDILVVGAHPDDAELGAGGTILKSVAQGKRVGILDLTRGELGTRGTPELRAEEARNATNILGILCRENVKLPDGFLENSEKFQRAIIPYLRRYRPQIVLANAIRDRHPDHAKASKLTSDACFLSGLKSIVTKDNEGNFQEPWRPKAVYFYVQDYHLKPDFIVDISAYYQQKMEAVLAFKSQFYTGTPQADGEITPISSPEYLKFLEGRAREYGRLVGGEFGEGFCVERAPGVEDLFHLR